MHIWSFQRHCGHSIRALFLVVTASCLVDNAFGWGFDTHRLIARLAQRRLNPLAEAEVTAALNNGDLDEFATHADSFCREAGNDWCLSMHYVNTPEDQCFYDPQRNCPGGVCVTSAMANYTERLITRASADPFLDLALLEHWVQDMAQPMHAGWDTDAGGNGIDGTFFGSSWNLHSLWDSGLPQRRWNTDFSGINDYENYLVDQLNGARSSEASQWISCLQQRAFSECYNDWTSESAQACCDVGYYDQNGRRVADGFSLDQAYYDHAVGTLETQILKSSVRLAGIINMIWPEDPEDTSTFSSVVATTGPSGTCSNSCGGQSAGDCWCNSACVNFGDCCPDYQHFCIASTTQATTRQTTTTTRPTTTTTRATTTTTRATTTTTRAATTTTDGANTQTQATTTTQTRTTTTTQTPETTTEATQTLPQTTTSAATTTTGVTPTEGPQDACALLSPTVCGDRGVCVNSAVHPDGWMCVCEPGYEDRRSDQRCTVDRRRRIQFVFSQEMEDELAANAFIMAMTDAMVESMDGMTESRLEMVTMVQYVEPMVVLAYFSGAVSENEPTSYELFQQLVDEEALLSPMLAEAVDIACLDCGDVEVVGPGTPIVDGNTTLPDSSGGLSIGVVIGVACGVLVLLAAVGTLAFFIMKRKRAHADMMRNHEAMNFANANGPHAMSSVHVQPNAGANANAGYYGNSQQPPQNAGYYGNTQQPPQNAAYYGNAQHPPQNAAYYGNSQQPSQNFGGYF